MQAARDGDFEDALQLGSAHQRGCQRFVTLDAALAKAYRGVPGLAIDLIR